MKDTLAKKEFIRLRAEGKPYSAIAEELKISKATCTAWAKELEMEINYLKKESLNELYESVKASKEQRVMALAETLQKIDEALRKIDFSEIPPIQLLKCKLEYQKALKEECLASPEPILNGDDATIEANYLSLLQRLQTGLVSESQAKLELFMIEKINSKQRELDIDSSFGSFCYERKEVLNL